MITDQEKTIVAWFWGYAVAAAAAILMMIL